MITIKVKQDISPDFPTGWAVFEYQDKEAALEHWAFLKDQGSVAEWINKGEYFILK